MSLATKGIGPLAAPLLLLVTCYFLLATFHLTTPSPLTATFSACSYYLAETVYQGLLLLVGFDTLTYRKDYD